MKALRPLIAAINELEPRMQQLSDEQLAAKTQESSKNWLTGPPSMYILVEAFATVRGAGRRVFDMRHYDVQLIGGIVLHRGKIAEMRAVKENCSSAFSYLNALEGKGVHVVTVNDYLARRDAEWMGRIYKFLGLTVGIIVHDLDDEERATPTPAILPTAPTTNSASTTFATI